MKENWDVDFRYVFSGNLTPNMVKILQELPNFEPYSILISQVDRSSMNAALGWKESGFCDWLFCDSGAFSVHTGKKHVTQDEYIEYVNSIMDKIDICAQLDTIPGKFKQPKSTQDYIDSAESSWENFLYMRKKVSDKHKVMPVFHFGEDIKYLKRMLEYVDEQGDQLDYIGLSPANDASVKDRSHYLDNMFEVIHKSSNPNVKTHVYGFTSLDAMSKFPCYSADSITHRLISGYNKIYTENFGIISLSRRPKSKKIKSNMSFTEVADDYNLDKLRQEFYAFGITPEYAKEKNVEFDDVLDWAAEDNNIRVAFNMKSIQKLANTKYKYHVSNHTKTKKLFQIK